MIVAGAVLDRCEFELDLLLRRSELEVLGAVDKKREALDYRAVLPNGFMALGADGGRAGARGAGLSGGAGQDLSLIFGRSTARR